MEQSSSNIFEGYRSVGLVTNSLPFIVRHAKNPQDTRIVTIVGRTFHTYSNNLSLVEVSIPHEYDIKALISDEHHIYSASGRVIFCWGRGSKTLINKLDNGHQADVYLLSKLGPHQLVSVDEDNVLFHWGLKDKEILNIISHEPETFKITVLCQPKAYKNKILLGSEQGKLYLMNVPEEKILFEFSGWGSAVKCLLQSPIEDVVGIGLADGHVHIHNIRFNESVMKIYQEYGPITTMSFRMDGQPYLVTASQTGHLMIWNLERKRLSTQIMDAHVGSSISKCQFIRNSTHLVTSASDNCLKIWSLDMSDGGGNLLSQRAGHSQPPSQIKFYGQKGFNLLTAGQDSTMKMFHMYSERLNRNLGTARMNSQHKSKNKENMEINKLPPITCFACETVREKQWDNIVACHKGLSVVTTWNYDKFKMGQHVIMQPTFDKHEVTAKCVCITSDGNFVIIGFSNGLIFKYNLQSGIFRLTYQTEALSDHRAHDGPVTGVSVDGLDLVLISGGADSKIRMWNFKTGILLDVWDCLAPILKFILHKDNNLLAIALENNHIEVRDLEARTLIRQFPSQSEILDMTFSPDSRWLIVSYADTSIITWDLNLGKVIDAFRLAKPCISLDISPTGEFLATAHDDSLGINIWCNYTLYCPTILRPIDSDKPAPMLDMPHVKCDHSLYEDENEDKIGEDKLTGYRVLPNSGELDGLSYESPDYLSEEGDYITASGLAPSRWKNLLSLEEIRQKQLIEEEEERKRKQIKVPFFIPVKDGLKPKLDGDVVKELNSQKTNQDSTNVIQNQSKISELQLLSPLSRTLINCSRTNQFDTFIEQMKELGPSAVDAEIRSLGKDVCGSKKPMLCFLDAIEWKLTNKRDYELVNSWLALFLKTHSDIIQTDRELQSKCKQLIELVDSNWGRLREQYDQVFCVLNFIRSSIL